MTGPRTLTLDQIDQIEGLKEQAQGVIFCIQTTSQADLVPDDAIPNACWAVTNLLDQMLLIVTGEVTND